MHEMYLFNLRNPCSFLLGQSLVSTSFLPRGGRPPRVVFPSETFTACNNTLKLVKLIIISDMSQVEKWIQADEGFLECNVLKGMNLPFSLAPC